jgi:AAT family amino acid transporter
MLTQLRSIVSVILIGLDVPYNYPKLSSKTVATSPFTLVFKRTGAKGAGSFMNAVIMTSVLSAGNHALFAGARLLYSLSAQGHAPKVFARLNRHQVPWIAVLATSIISVVCFGSSYIGAGQLWNWLQKYVTSLSFLFAVADIDYSLVGVSNMLCWTAIGITSVRFRSALERQGKTHLLPFKNWTYPYGPWLCIVLNIILILVQGWSCFSPKFSAVDFVSYYIELPLMLVMFLGWKWWKKTTVVALERMDLETDTHSADEVVLPQSSTMSRLQRLRNWLL